MPRRFINRRPLVLRRFKRRAAPSKLVRTLPRVSLAAVVASQYNIQAARPQGLRTGISQPYQTQFTRDIGNLVNSAVGFAGAGLFFTAADVSSASFLTAFDQYRIDRIEVWLEPQLANADPRVTAQWVSAVDMDDANVPGTFETVAHKPGAVIGSGTAGHYHCFTPHVADALYAGVFTSFGNRTSPWIDSASPAVQHYGIKIGLSPSPSAVGYTATARYTMSFRGPGIQ